MHDLNIEYRLTAYGYRPNTTRSLWLPEFVGIIEAGKASDSIS